jgi:hypothetical protein
MNRFVSLALALLLVGCAHSNVSLNSSGSAAGGTSTFSGHVSAAGSGAAAVVLFGIAAVAIHGRELSNGGTSDVAPSKPPPELDASRRVNEQDCSKPIKDWSANLKCR